MDKKSIQNLEFDKIIELLAQKINTSLGKQKARNIEITNNYEAVVRLQEETSEAQKLIIEGSGVSITGISDVHDKLKLAAIGAGIDALSLLHIAHNLKMSRIVYDKISGREDLPILCEQAQKLFAYRELEERIFDAIISEDEISDNASTELKHIRREIRNTKERIKTKLSQIVSSESTSKYLQETIVTQRQDRYVIPVKAEHRSNFPGIVHDTSSSGATIFVEPMAIVEMNNALRISVQKEKEEIERILLEFSNEVGKFADAISENQNVLGYFDFVMGKGLFSVSINAVAPKINQNKIIRLKNAKHPLIDPKVVVPLNINIGDRYNTLVITGPNTGGKTVTLKTVGLFVLMVQAGLHIPCDFGSTVAVFDNVFSDIGDEQSISQNLSTFSSHMVNIVRILKKATKKSLLLLDELGSGTDPDEGSALAIAILEHLKEKKTVTIATTHYTDLKNYALNTPFVENASVEFDVETLSPTYRLLIGVPGKSNAFFISQKLGLDKEIIDSAKMHLNEDTIRMEDILLKIEKDRIYIEKEKETIQATGENVKGRLANLERKERQLEANRERIIKEAKKEAQILIRNAKEESEKIVSQLRHIEKKSASLNHKEIEQLRNKMSKLGEEFSTNEELISIDKTLKPLSEENLSVGDTVYVSSFYKNASIVSIDSKKKQAVVQMDNMKINVPFAALQKPKEEKTEQKRSGAGKIYSSKSSQIKSEVDLRGLDSEQANEKLTKYLDDAYLSNIPVITIIHGIGTGVLKKGAESVLKELPYVKSYRPGSYGEGGPGVTIVTFR